MVIIVTMTFAFSRMGRNWIGCVEVITEDQKVQIQNSSDSVRL